ncbi:MAG: hypothetical protein PHP59_01450 [Methanofollis sp.]|uniref:hypothetical protein n=1 Tax=Methanofollis sp. TaxID=2052835 RepID=UPI00263757D5|nr:hypothetical protein [Methanofollis sp.]MDD4254019.1 hypothetical protein [Methanofollis sp.]
MQTPGHLFFCFAICLALCLIAAGCTGLAGAPENEATVVLQPNAPGLPLTGIWNIVLEKTGATNETAVLNSADLMIGADGEMERMSLEFWDGSEGNADLVHVDLSFFPDRAGKISWSRAASESVPVSLHPLDVLGELEQVDFADLHLGKKGLWIEVSGSRGSIGYGGGDYDLALLENGTFTPLREVRFAGDVQGCPITIMGRDGQGGNVTITETRDFLFWRDVRTSTTYQEPDPERENIVAFVPESLAMADHLSLQPFIPQRDGSSQVHPLSPPACRSASG